MRMQKFFQLNAAYTQTDMGASLPEAGISDETLTTFLVASVPNNHCHLNSRLCRQLLGFALPSYAAGVIGGLIALPTWGALKSIRPANKD